MHSTNLRLIAPKHRKMPEKGDYFLISPAANRYFVARVIDNSAEITKIGKPNVALLVYVYRPEFSSEEDVDISILHPESLLFPPRIISRTTLTGGYSKNIGHKDLTSEDLLSAHFFTSVGGLVNEFGDIVTKPNTFTIDTAGDFGVYNKFGFDNLVSDAIGISRAVND